MAIDNQPVDRKAKPIKITPQEVLCEEALAIHEKTLVATTPTELYRKLNGLNSAALCLSGGGIRSAAFALGVIQALAKHPCTAGNHQHVDTAEASLLRRFDYLSTVSGGGYIGSWFSAWLHRPETTFKDIWARLVDRPAGPDQEPEQIQNLRRNSNYLTPKLGAMSADSWAAAALYVRNLSLNWLVVVPAACVILILLKHFAALVASLWRGQELPAGVSVYAPCAAMALLIVMLTYTHLNRPTRKTLDGSQHRFLVCAVLPAMLSGAAWAAFAIAPDFLQRVHDPSQWLLRYQGWDMHLAEWVRCIAQETPCADDIRLKAARLSRAGLLIAGTFAGSAIYGAAWLLACILSFFQRGRTSLVWDLGKNPLSFIWDLLASLLSGAVYGAILAYGAWLLLYFSAGVDLDQPRLRILPGSLPCHAVGADSTADG